MDSSTEISIPKTINKNSDSLFNNKYTVIPSQLYEIHLIIHKETQAIVHKRYREIRALYDNVKAT